MLAQTHDSILTVHAHGATNLQDVETLGKQDPYFQFSLDLTNPKSFQKTFVHKNAGKNPVWNQSFNVTLNGEPELFFEIMDEETAADAVIGFAAIHINQIFQSPGGILNAAFPVYTPAGKEKGQVNLTLAINGASIGSLTHFSTGYSHINDAHKKRVNSMKNKERIADVGGMALGGLLAVGAGLLANKISNDNKKEEKSRREAEEAEQAERDRFEQEKKHFEEQKSTSHETSYHEERGHIHIHSHDHGHDHEHNSHREWDPVGTYAPGDKVRYHGRDYICLQGHTSNPTWEPTQAHSLWRAD
ncbi:hypothetical protein BG004_001933 [Podila humilis]|nr:hypothetical protein BG004_001933 [Podila humilis]